MIVEGHRVHFFRRDDETRSTLLLHGFTGRIESWDEIAHAMPGGGVFGVALPGHTPETPVLGELGFDGAVERIAEVIAALRPPRLHVVGYSLGARFALGLLAAKREPTNLERVTLIGVNPGIESE